VEAIVPCFSMLLRHPRPMSQYIFLSFNTCPLHGVQTGETVFEFSDNVAQTCTEIAQLIDENIKYVRIFKF